MSVANAIINQKTDCQPLYIHASGSESYKAGDGAIQIKFHFYGLNGNFGVVNVLGLFGLWVFLLHRMKSSFLLPPWVVTKKMTIYDLKTLRSSKDS